MTILSEIQTVIAPLNIPVETGFFSDEAPDTYIVVVPMSDTYGLHADNKPQIDVQEVRISLFTKENYTQIKNSVISALIAGEFTITGRQYIGHDTDAGYFQYNIDVSKFYEIQEEQ